MKTLSYARSVVENIRTYYGTDERAPLLGLRSLRDLPECKFYANDGNDYAVIELDIERFAVIVMSNEVDREERPTLIGDLIHYEVTYSKADAIRTCLSIIKTDNDFE